MRPHSSTEHGFVDMLVLLAVAALLLAAVLPTLVTAVNALQLQETLTGRAFALARRTSRSEEPPPRTLSVAGHDVSVSMAGSYVGCSAVVITLTTTVAIGIGPLASPVTLRATAAAPNGAYDRPNPMGADCGA